MKIVHVGMLDKFIPPFAKFIETEFDISDHQFYFFSDKNKYQGDASSDRLVVGNLSSFIKLIKCLYSSDKIILHSMFSQEFFFLLLIQPWLLKKCYWIIWGGDLYFKKIKKPGIVTNVLEFLRTIVLSRVNHIITPVYGDYQLAKEWYNPKAKFYNSFCYESNLFKELPGDSTHTTVNVLLGNSAAESNNHSSLFKQILPLMHERVRLFVPLSYGDKNYAKKVIEEGTNMFGSQFIPMTEFMPFDDYLKFLNSIDIAVWGHDRQQGLGNAITILGYGKKLFLKRSVTTWDTLSGMDLKIFDLANLSFDSFFPESERNRTIIREKFSRANLISELKNIFNSTIG